MSERLKDATKIKGKKELQVAIEALKVYGRAHGPKHRADVYEKLKSKGIEIPYGRFKRIDWELSSAGFTGLPRRYMGMGTSEIKKEGRKLLDELKKESGSISIRK